jgi:DNA repair ATPase RecN
VSNVKIKVPSFDFDQLKILGKQLREYETRLASAAYRAEGYEAVNIGRLAQAADHANAALFQLSNVANSLCDIEAAEDAARNWHDVKAEDESADRNR